MAADQPDEWATGQLDLAAYLRRIGYAGDLAPTAATLAGLHRARMTYGPTWCCGCTWAGSPGWPTPASAPG